jgi:hypothetical protein
MMVMHQTYGLVDLERLNAALATVDAKVPARRSFARMRTEAPVPELVEGEEVTRPSGPFLTTQE